MSVLGYQTQNQSSRMQKRKGKLFGHDGSDDAGSAIMPSWDHSIQQRLLYELVDSGAITVGGFGARGLAALEEKAAEIHHTATDGVSTGVLIADLEQTTWDAAETLAWFHRADPDNSALLPHREADAVASDRNETKGAGYWVLDSGDFVRCNTYDSVELRRQIAAGEEGWGQLFEATTAIPQAGLRLALAAVDYVWKVQGGSAPRVATRV
jgi:hypothetical protein